MDTNETVKDIIIRTAVMRLHACLADEQMKMRGRGLVRNERRDENRN